MKPFELFRNVAFVLASFLFSASFVSCSDDETEEPPFDSETKQTILMYMPWSGPGIYTYFLNNISAFEQAVENNHGFDGNALMVFISENDLHQNTCYTSRKVRSKRSAKQCFHSEFRKIFSSVRRELSYSSDLNGD